MKYPATLLCDFYKVSHRHQYPDNTEIVYSTWIPRTSRLDFADEVVAFGFQAFVKEYLVDYFNEQFFKRPLANVVSEYKRVIKFALGVENPDVTHIMQLHSLGYLPLLVKAVPEGTLVPLRVPMLTIENTKPQYAWLTNYIETIASCSLWQSATSATIALAYRRILDSWADLTSDITDFVDFQGHDFSFRGMSSLESAASSGAGHLLSFVGTDTIPAILYLEEFYEANIEKELVGCSVPATEHSVMCAGGATDEYETYLRLLTEVHPSGIVSIVSDTWDLWEVITKTLPRLKEVIMSRDGKTVIRPDSGDPADIICGNPKAEKDSPEYKGVIKLLYEIFGGERNSKGFIQLDSHIGAIYGDAITVPRCVDICSRLRDKGFASTNIVFGIGSYTYQYNTRDTFGFAMKATHCVIDGKEVNIFKDPATDKDKVKKSLTGRCVVEMNYDGLVTVRDNLSIQESNEAEFDLLQPIFWDGEAMYLQSLSEIKALLKAHN
jgi:nicotinamide phosphoribosyltransferase